MAELNSRDYHRVTRLVEEYFLTQNNFIKTPTGCIMTRLSACEDPRTVATYFWNGQGNGIVQKKGCKWPLKQTGQMDMELEFLKSIQSEPNKFHGFYCETESYRDEPNPKAGRHASGPFPLLEWEEGGDFNTLLKREHDLLVHLGYKFPKGMDHFPIIEYEKACEDFGVSILDDEHEQKLCNIHGPVVFLINFPIRTSPFFNMKLDKNKNSAMKCDVLLSGIETIGSAERSCDKEEMRLLFDTISNGEYKDKLYELFGADNIEKELEEYFRLPFAPRCGGGIGLTRLIRSMKMEGLLV